MADASVEEFLKNKKANPDAKPPEVSEGQKPLLQMKKYVVPKVKSAASESTDLNNSQENNSSGGLLGKKQVQVEIEVENFDVLYTKHLT